MVNNCIAQEQEVKIVDCDDVINVIVILVHLSVFVVVDLSC